MPGERLVCVTRIHALVTVPPAILAGFGVLAGAVGFLLNGVGTAGVGGLGAMVGVVGLITFVGAAVIIVSRLIERATTEYACTTHRIHIKSGVLTTQLREMPLAKVEALLMEQPLFGRLVGYGTLVFKGSGGTRRTCQNIERPTDFHRQVQEQVALAQGAR